MSADGRRAGSGSRAAFVLVVELGAFGSFRPLLGDLRGPSGGPERRPRPLS